MLPAILLAVLLIGLLALVGVNPLETRLTTLWTGAALVDERWRIWRNTLAVARHFPLVGSGYGTLAYVEPVYRIRPYTPGDADWGVLDYAHSDFLHALAEGGIVRLVLTITLVAFTILLGVRAVRQNDGRPAGPLALGALLAVVTLSIHGLFDFLIPAPSVAILAVVTAAQLAALAKPSDTRHEESSAVRRLVSRVLCPIGAAAVSAILVLQGWQACAGLPPAQRGIRGPPRPAAGL